MKNEMMVILHVVDMRKNPYLIRNHLQIKTNPRSLKHFFENRLSLLEQQKRVTKMLGYNYEIIYKKGEENVVVDVLSKKYDKEDSLFPLTLPMSNWIEDVHLGMVG